MWKLRKYLIKKLAGRQTVVLNTTIDYQSYQSDKFHPEKLYILVKGHYKKFIIENVHVQSFDTDKINYDDLDDLAREKMREGLNGR